MGLHKTIGGCIEKNTALPGKEVSWQEERSIIQERNGERSARHIPQSGEGI